MPANKLAHYLYQLGSTRCYNRFIETKQKVQNMRHQEVMNLARELAAQPLTVNSDTRRMDYSRRYVEADLANCMTNTTVRRRLNRA